MADGRPPQKNIPIDQLDQASRIVREALRPWFLPFGELLAAAQQPAKTTAAPAAAAHQSRLAKLARLKKNGFIKAKLYGKLRIDKADYYRWQAQKTVSPGIKKRLDDAVDAFPE